MKIIQWFSPFVLAAILAPAVTLADEAAVIRKNNVNVRGQPSFQGEIITQLKQGEKVVVVEEITVNKPKEGEPANWFKIQMPSNTPVWVNAEFIDPQTKAVKPTRLNLRGGPGENYSVVGRLQRGDVVKEIRTVEGWTEIETPPGTFAYIAADLAKKETAAAPTPPTQPTNAEKKSEPASIAAAPPAPVSTPPTPVPPPPPAVEKSVSPEPAPVIATQPPPRIEPPPPIVVEPAPVTTVLPSAPPPVTAPTVSQPLPKRVALREGIVRRAISIQAPTYYELVGTDTGKVMNYIHLSEAMLEKLGTDIKQFKDYLGRTVVVSGEEGLDSRWPNTPVIEVETLKLVL